MKRTINTGFTPGNTEVDTTEPSMPTVGEAENIAGKYDGYLHGEIQNGKGVLVDGDKREVSILVESIRDVYKNLPNVSTDGGISPKARWLAEMSTIFHLSTQQISNPDLDSVCEAVEEEVPEGSLSVEPNHRLEQKRELVPSEEAAGSDFFPSLSEKNDCDDEDDSVGDD